MIRRNGLNEDIKAQCQQSLVEMFIDFEVQEQVQDQEMILILKIKILKQRDLEDQDQDLILKIKIVPSCGQKPLRNCQS